MSKLRNKTPEKVCRALEDHQKYISRITKTLYYGKFPKTDGLSLPVTELAADLFSEAQRGRSLNRLHCDDAAKISRNACVSPCSLILAVLYLERLRQLNPEYLEKTAPSDLFLVSLMVSCKFLFDDGENDEVFIDEWAKSGETSIKNLIQLERDFLKAIEWEIYINKPSFWKKMSEIEGTLARKQGIIRGFFTYTELEILLKTIDLSNLIQYIMSISIILTAAYTAALLTLLGSVFIVSQIPGSSIQSNKISQSQNNSFILPITNQDSPKIEIGQLKTDLDCPQNEYKALHVLKTGIFLVSIENLLKPFCNNTENNEVKTSWDWWNVPTMQWLYETSNQMIDKLDMISRFDFGYILDTFVLKVKHLELEDNIQKATKTRIQDQIEMSWHKEWIDTINNQGLHYVHNVKS